MSGSDNGDGAPRQFTSRGDDAGHRFKFQHPQQLPQEAGGSRPRHEGDNNGSRVPPTGPLRMRKQHWKQAGPLPPKKAPVPAHDRPILSSNFRDKTPELMAGMVTGGEFLIAPDETDGVEGGADREILADPVSEAKGDTEMEILGEDDYGGRDVTEAKVDSVVPSIEVAGDAGQSVESGKKRVDVISMIRSFKTRVAVEKPRNPVAENDDFIPFSFSEERKPRRRFTDRDQDLEDDGNKRRKRNDGSVEVIAGSNFSHRDNFFSHRGENQPSRDLGPPGTSEPPNLTLPPPPGLPSVNLPAIEEAPDSRDLSKRGDGTRSSHRGLNETGNPLSPPSASGRRLDVPRGRKRNYSHITTNQTTIDGNVISQYWARPGVDPFPWNKVGGDHSRCLNMGSWLHREIIDFVSYIQPRAYEHAVRRELIHRIRRIVTDLWVDADVRVFGSFAAEMYLPTSDIDLVVISSSFAQNDIPRYSSKTSLYKLSHALRNSGVTKPGSLAVIANAKVPIVKFIDIDTNLHVDISFENSSGLIANETFQKWKVEYPAMPILVIVIKQFLAMRGLNEVYIGGLGSFSVTCMVVSMLQHLPSLSSGKVDGRLHLGVMLLEFLELYGKNFNSDLIGICVDSRRPGYFNKEEVFPPAKTLKPPQPGLICIQDPNKSDNDISRSSYLIKLIMMCWADAYDDIVDQMGKLDGCEFLDREYRSLLGTIIGGNYRPVEAQRDLMKQVYARRIGSMSDIEMEERMLGGNLDDQALEIRPPLVNANTTRRSIVSQQEAKRHSSNDREIQAQQQGSQKRKARPTHANLRGGGLGSKTGFQGKGGPSEPIVID